MWVKWNSTLHERCSEIKHTTGAERISYSGMVVLGANAPIKRISVHCIE
jgi:hypothetical protein